MPEDITERIPVTSLAGPQRAPHIMRVTGKSRLYYDGSIWYPSVTNVLSTVYPKKGLYAWMAKRGREAVSEYLIEHAGEPITKSLLSKADKHARGQTKRESNVAKNLGTRAHELISKDVQGIPIDVPDELLHVLEAWRDWKSINQLKLVDTETGVYLAGAATHMKYAGTVDLIFERPNGDILLVDIKTGKAVYGDALLQVVAYGGALKWLAPTKIEVGMQVLRLGKELPEFEVVPVTEPRKLWELWAAALKFYHELEGK